MRKPTRTRLAALAVAAATGVGLLATSAPAMAAGNGAVTETQHAHGDQTQGLVVLDLLPTDAPPLPAGCWANPDLAIVSTSGNAVEHDTVNKAQDFWFTSTYAGDAAVYPIVQPPTVDANGNVAVDTSQPPLYVGHLTTWFGMNDNNKNGNFSATASFHGTSTSDPGQRVSLNGSMHLALNANGQATVVDARATC